MAGSIQLQPPQPFDFKKPDEWEKWKRRFEQFLSAAGLEKEDDSRKVSTLLYCLGEEAEGVLSSTDISDESRKKYKDVIAQFDAHFRVRRNLIFERARFNKRDQRDNESAEEYITALYALSETCEYGTLRDEMLRDRLVAGIRDTALSDKLQLDSKLTLETAKKMIRQKEAVREQRVEMTSRKEHLVEDVTRRPTGSQSRSKGHRPRTAPTPNKCQRCGRNKHQGQDKCPARNVICHRCKKRGHFKAHCLSKGVAAASELQTEDLAFLGALAAEGNSTWRSTVNLNGTDIQFKLDTGAEVTAVSAQTCKALGLMGKLQAAGKVLYGPSRQSLRVIGQFPGELRYKEHTYSETIFVVRGLKNDLLGLPALDALQLVKKVEAAYSSSIDVKRDFPKVFTGLGNFGEPYSITLKDNARPRALFTPRNVPIPLRDKVKKELERMESLGVISSVSEPTSWCAGMVVVPKRSGDVRICVDLKALNESVMRETHPIPKVDSTLAQLAGAAVFSKLDAYSGFWQIPLSDSSKLLTTFITPFGRYAFNKLPFGIASALEIFQRRINQILEGLDGVVCMMDDILVFAKDHCEHDSRLREVLKRLESAHVTLNTSKCEFGKSSVKFLGHIIDGQGVRADPEKTEAIRRLETPSSVTDLRRFLGMVNQLGKFSPRIAEMTQPLRELLSTKNAWVWGPQQERAYGQIKEELTKTTTLMLYDPRAEVKVSADASSFGLGAVLLQRSQDTWRPVAYASRSMSPTERRYAQIEKEALAITWACQRFSDYVLGRNFTIKTDHKPLIPILNTKSLDSLPPQVVRFRLRLARFDYVVKHVPGKLLYTADTLSRAPIPETDETELEEEVKVFVDGVTEYSLPASKERTE